MRTPALALASLLLAGCAGHRPAWVGLRSGAHSEPGGARVFLGRAHSASVSNPLLAWNIAEERARAELDLVLSAFLAGMAADYTAGRPDADPAETRALIASLKELVVEAVFSGASGGRFIDRRGRHEAVWRAEYPGFKKEFQARAGIDEDFRRWALERMDARFDAAAR